MSRSYQGGPEALPQILSVLEDFLRSVPLDVVQMENAKKLIDEISWRVDCLLEVPKDGERFWSCKIGPCTTELPSGSDFPMRKAVKERFFELCGYDAEACFSGWGAHLTHGEREVMEDGPQTQAAQEMEKGKVGK